MSATTLRKLLNQPGIIRAPGAYDAWSAKLVEQAGFPAVYMTGYGVSASVIGRPDVGLLTMTEMVTAAKNIVSSVHIPVIADADNGYGGTLNVIRTVQEYIHVGVAAIQLEDQVTPKRCGHMEGKQIIPKEEMVAKIKAAVYARQDKDTVIIARTDARAVNGFKDAVVRANSYAAAGADVIFLEAPQSIEEVDSIAQSIKIPLLSNMVEHGKTPFLKASALEAIGYKIVIYPVSTLYAATQTVCNLLTAMKNDDTTDNYRSKMVAFPQFNSMIGLAQLRDLEKSFL